MFVYLYGALTLLFSQAKKITEVELVTCSETLKGRSVGLDGGLVVNSTPCLSLNVIADVPLIRTPEWFFGIKFAPAVAV